MKGFKNNYVFFVSFFPHLLKKAHKDNILLYAQGLTYNTLLTIIPILGLIISLGRSFLNEDAFIQQSFIFFSNYLTSSALIKVMEELIKIVENLKGLPLGKFSLIFYFLMSVGLLFLLEDSLNHVFVSFKRRTFKERVLFYWLVMTFAPFIFFLPLLIQTSLKSYFNYKLFLYFLFLWLFFYLIYIYFPARKVSKWASIKGAFFTTILWYFFSYLFGLYVKKAVAYSKLYGSLSVIPIFILFLFLNWLIFLIGAEITFLLEKKFFKKKSISLTYPLSLMLILCYLAVKFYEGKALFIKDLEGELPYEEESLLMALKELSKRGYIKIKEEEIFWLKPPEKIKLMELINEEEFKLLKDFIRTDKSKEILSALELSLNNSINDIIFSKKVS